MASPPQDSNPGHAGVVGTTQVGERGGRYEILRELARGGMATVYLARQPELDRFVVLKEMAPQPDPSWAQRFRREALMAGSLSHPNIVTVLDYFVRDGTPYIAMEHVESGSLRRYIDGVTLAQIGGVLEGLLAGLAHAHARGIVHRDLKPENLMVTAEGRVKIADFGIATVTADIQSSFRTQTGMTVGTPHYMAPEQAMGQKPEIGPWTDMYSVGCMAFELLTGEVPFHDTDAPMAVLLRHVNEAIPPVASVAPEVDQQISDWVASLLAKAPKRRVRSAQTAWDDLEDILLRLLGPRWRREARLSERPPEAGDGGQPLTPAAFERPSEVAASDEFVSFNWGAAPSAAPSPAADTPPPLPDPPAPPVEAGPPPVEAGPDSHQPPSEVAPTLPPHTPPPADSTPAPHPARRRFTVAAAVLLLAVAAGAAALVLRPDDEPTRAGAPPAPTRPETFTTDAFSVRLPAGWEARCLDEAGSCAGRPVESPTRRSAFIEGSGAEAPRVSIDRTPASPVRTVALMAENQDRTLQTALDDYRRVGSIRPRSVPPSRRARAFSFESSQPAFRNGAVYVFKAADDIYIVTGTAPTAAAAGELARAAAASLETL